MDQKEIDRRNEIIRNALDSNDPRTEGLVPECIHLKLPFQVKCKCGNEFYIEYDFFCGGIYEKRCDKCSEMVVLKVI